MKIALTGASGFLGTALLRRLHADGHRVSALVRDPARLQEAAGPPERIVVGDIRDPEPLAALAEGAEVFIHTVSNFRTAADPPEVTTAVNVDGTRVAFEAAAAAGVRRFLHCSTIGVHGNVRDTPAREDSPFNPGDPYQATKLAAEAVARSWVGRSAMEVVILRPSSLYGPGDLRTLKMFRMLASRSFLMLGRCEANFHAAYIDDVVNGFMLAMTSEAAAGEIFLLAGPAYVPLRSYIAEAAGAVGAPMPWLRIPYGPMYAAAVLCEAICLPLRIEPPLHRRRVRFFRNNRAFSIDKARAVLGYEPEVSLRDGMARTVAWYRSQGFLPAGT